MSKKHKKENQSETSNMATSEEITIETATPEKVVSELTKSNLVYTL